MLALLFVGRPLPLSLIVVSVVVVKSSMAASMGKAAAAAASEDVAVCNIFTALSL